MTETKRKFPETNQIRKKKKIETEERDWADLPVDLLESIITCLSFTDRVRLFAVCTTWRSTAITVSNRHQDHHRPWLLNDLFLVRDIRCADRRRFYIPWHSWKFFDPWNKKFYTINVPELVSMRIICSFHGWLLIHDESTASIFFFHPFSNARICLPNLESIIDGAFSSSPTSPECSIFIVNMFTHTLISISTLSFGKKEWITRYYTHDLPFYPTCSCPVFCNGLFYYMGVRSLGAFDVDEGTWTVFDKPSGVFNGNFMTELGGELFVGRNPRFRKLLGICKRDRPSMAWMEEEHLGGLLLLNSLTASFSAMAIVKRKENNIRIPRHITHNRYLRETLRSERVGIIEFSDSIWIEPKLFQPSSKELNWGVS
ncbi:F-box protein At3g56470-like [Magnolia sinica]|uniref:F-box protein At3g56470-like n=1 Tax=Magnolia sinica TaxID=86752 RepID=UPI002659536A|nr:F-box protein At3g56470-like [Magnolia sinica]